MHEDTEKYYLLHSPELKGSWFTCYTVNIFFCMKILKNILYSFLTLHSISVIFTKKTKSYLKSGNICWTIAKHDKLRVLLYPFPTYKKSAADDFYFKCISVQERVNSNINYSFLISPNCFLQMIFFEKSLKGISCNDFDGKCIMRFYLVCISYSILYCQRTSHSV